MRRWRRGSPSTKGAAARAGARSRSRSIWCRRLQGECGPDRAVLVDCLTLWLTNLMVEGRPVRAEMEGFLAALPRLSGTLVLVSNEVGLGVVPTDAMARAFIDHAGWLHQRIAEQADVVVFMAAGLPVHLKSPSDA